MLPLNAQSTSRFRLSDSKRVATVATSKPPHLSLHEPLPEWSDLFSLRSCSGFAAEQAVVARGCEEIDHLGVVAEPGLVLRTSRNDHEVALAADPLFGAKAELHFALRIHTICSFA